MTTDFAPFLAWLREQLATGDGWSIQVETEQLPALQQLLDHYDSLVRNEKKRKADLRRAQDRAGRKPTNSPTASTIRARQSRARKRAVRKEES